MDNRQEKNSEYCERLKRAVENAFSKLGEDAKEAILFHLTHNYRIKLGGADCSSLDEIEQALDAEFRSGAEIIIEWIRQEMEG